MFLKFVFLASSLCLLSGLLTNAVADDSKEKFYAAVYGLPPRVFISVLVTNSLHSLPNFFGYLEALDYPKDRISIWIATDHNVDGTMHIVKHWCMMVRKLYKSVDCRISYKWTYSTRDPYSKSVQRSKNKARLRQEAFEAALTTGADYLLTLDVNCFLINPKTLKILMEEDRTIIAPMLDPPDSSDSNFWYRRVEKGEYVNDELYQPIVKRKRLGCFPVSLIYGAVLIHLASPYIDSLSYHPPHPMFIGPVNDVKQFAFFAQMTGLQMNILNTEFFGCIMPTKTYLNINKAASDFFRFKLDTLASHPPLVYSNYSSRQRPPIINHALGLDAVFVVSLARRPHRRARMRAILNEYGLQHTIFDAIDGRNLNDSYLREMDIRYVDSGLWDFEVKTLRKGEIGCFLSHYTIWKTMLEKKLNTVLVMEDDVYFRSYFKKGLYKVVKEADKYAKNWDFIYLGRVKVNRDAAEPRVPGSHWLVKPTHSYLTLCYLLSRRGAKKLLDADPLRKMLPADEFISIMHGHPPKTGKRWEFEFRVGILNAYSSAPSLVEPTHFGGEEGYISDTAPPEEIAALVQKARKAKKVEEVDEKVRDDIKKKALQRQILKFKNLVTARNEL